MEIVGNKTVMRCINKIMKIGIPRALFYYYYFPLWEKFFKELEQEVILSNPTNKVTIKMGVEAAVDDACLPVKVFHGHVMDLAEKVDAIFIPRIVSIEPGRYICPKFLGLPEMIKFNLNDLPPIIDIKLDLYNKKASILEHFFKIGKFLNKSRAEVLKAYFVAIKNFAFYKNYIRLYRKIPTEVFNNEILNYDDNNFKTITNQSKPCFKVLLLGHPYNLYDDYISMNLIKKLKLYNVKIITYEMLSEKKIFQGAKKLSKEMFWTLGRNILGSAFYFLDNEKVDGIISVASFGCGPDSLVGELLERRVEKEYKLPFLYLNLDEHSGEAGFNTRLEAFFDILEGRLTSESNFSSLR
jgi:predicted nucleotide-binding protein (sugar kinase/HSP70/actin superfamily)